MASNIKGFNTLAECVIFSRIKVDGHTADTDIYMFFYEQVLAQARAGKLGQNTIYHMQIGLVLAVYDQLNALRLRIYDCCSAQIA